MSQQATTILDLIVKDDVQKFHELEKKLRRIITVHVTPFARDAALRKIEDVDSLYNIALLKLREAVNNFVYEPSYSQKHNEIRFLAMLREYVKNEMIDIQYNAGARKRKPKGTIRSFHIEKNAEDSEEGDMSFDPVDKNPSPYHIACAKEIKEKIEAKIKDEDEKKVFLLLCEGYTAEKIAGKLGIVISRVRHFIYERIQRRAENFRPRT